MSQELNPEINSEISTKTIAKYYQRSTWDYLLFYRTAFHQQMHYGFSRNQPKDLNPMENLVKYMAEVGGIKKNVLVLDAGCGMGGTSFLLHRRFGAKCIGISLVGEHMQYATRIAHKKNDDAYFLQADFHKSPFMYGSFDYVIAIESFDHALDKRQWIEHMATLLKPGGKLLIADGFHMEQKGSMEEESEYKKFLDGWAVPHLCTPAQASIWAKGAGLKNFHHENLTSEVLPHAYNIYRFGRLALPIRKLMAKIGIGNGELTGNAAATYYQYRTLNLGLWNYWFFGWEKK